MVLILAIVITVTVVILIMIVAGSGKYIFIALGNRPLGGAKRKWALFENFHKVEDQRQQFQRKLHFINSKERNRKLQRRPQQ